jgi:hypothetical protein
VKVMGSCALDAVLDKVTIQPVTANPQRIDATTVRLVKCPPFGIQQNLRAVLLVE